MEMAVSGYILKVFLKLTFGNWRNSNNNQSFSVCSEGVKDLLVAIDDINVGLYIGNQQVFFSKDKAAFCRYGSLRSIYPTSESSQTQDVILEFPLVAETLDDIESRRKGGDANFGLDLSCLCSVYCGDEPSSVSNSLKRLLSREQLTNESMSFSIPQSDWVKLLEKSRYGVFILLESPLIICDADDSYKGAIELLKKSRLHLRSGNYSESVGECRKVIESIMKSKGSSSFARNIKELSNGDVGKNLEAKNIKERFELVLNSTINVTHRGPHPEGETFSYESATAILLITSSVVSLAMHGELPERSGTGGHQHES